MKSILVVFIFLTSIVSISQTNNEVIYLWENGAPGFETLMNEPEEAKDYWVKNVHNPSLIVFKPEHPNGTAVVICPGGGYNKLVITSEGYRAARYLNSLGITAFILKYRLPREENSPYDLDIHLRQDGLRAMRTVRANAEKYGIDPSKIGMLGFSAGGEVVAEVMYKENGANENSSDKIEQTDAKPNFQILVYPGPLGVPDIFPEDLPPAFMVVTNDDACCSSPVVKILNGYRKTKASVEMHLYSQGGHAFNMGTRSELKSLNTWPDRLKDWLQIEGFIPN